MCVGGSSTTLTSAALFSSTFPSIFPAGWGEELRLCSRVRKALVAAEEASFASFSPARLFTSPTADLGVWCVAVGLVGARALSDPVEDSSGRNGAPIAVLSTADTAPLDGAVGAALQTGASEKAGANAPPTTLPNVDAAKRLADPDTGTAAADEGCSELADAPRFVDCPPRFADGLAALGGPMLKPLRVGSPFCTCDSYGLDKGDLAGV